MTNQVNQAFVDFYNENKHLYTDKSPYGIMLTTFQAATKASESEINSLKQRVEELQIMYRGAKRLLKFNTEKNPLLIEIAELTASNNKLREELENTLTSLQEMKDKYEIQK